MATDKSLGYEDTCMDLDMLNVIPEKNILESIL
jgi:hypothetical protein